MFVVEEHDDHQAALAVLDTYLPELSVVQDSLDGSDSVLLTEVAVQQERVV